MSEYIKKEEVISAVCFGRNQELFDKPCEPPDCAIRQAINSTPTADVVEVVRCKDCKCYEPHGNGTFGLCTNKKCKGIRAEVDYCSYGERREV